MSTASDIADVLGDLRRLNDGEPAAVAARDTIMATKHALIERLRHDQPRAVVDGVVVCARPGCTNPVVRQPGRTGRPPIYCSPRCRPSRRSVRAAITIEIGRNDDADDPRPGRTWTVTLRRGRHSVMVGHDLGRFAATALSADLERLLHPRSHPEGGDID